MNNLFSLKNHLQARLRRINQALNRLLGKGNTSRGMPHKAMRYSVFAGGKRLRPILCLSAAELCGGRRAARKALPAACALEMIHTYSLIHDDLPAMDDDDVRRGMPTCHKKFGTAHAILAGDALLTDAFGLLAGGQRPGANALKVIFTVARAAGSLGMVAGQAADIETQGKFEFRMTNDELRIKARSKKDRNCIRHSKLDIRHLLHFIHRHKTGALLRASLRAGALHANASPAQLKALDRYGESIGLAFQIADDILDVIGNKKALGKRGSDKKNGKLTFPALYGLETSKKLALREIEKAKRALTPFGRRAEALRALADFIIERQK